MWKLLLLFGFLSVGCATPIHENEVTKNDIDLAVTEVHQAINETYKGMLPISYMVIGTIKRTYFVDVRASYEKLQSATENVVESTANYTMNKIIQFINQTGNNRELMQCVDLKNSVIVIHEAVKNVLTNVHICKWKVIYPILDDLYLTKEAIKFRNPYVTKWELEALKCTQNTSSTNDSEILQCLKQLKERVQKNIDGVTFLRDLELSHKEKLASHLNVLSQCNNHIDLAAIKIAQDREFDKIEKCLNDKQKESSNTADVNNKISLEEMVTAINRVSSFLENVVDRSWATLRLNFPEYGKREDAAVNKLNLADAKDTMQIIENSWKSNGHENDTLSTALTSEEYATLLECSKNSSHCGGDIVFRSYDNRKTLGDILEINPYREELSYFSAITEVAGECEENLSDPSNFNDAVRCILWVAGQASQVVTDEMYRLLIANQVTLQLFSKLLNDPVKCIPEFTSRSHMPAIKQCFSKTSQEKADLIFNF